MRPASRSARSSVEKRRPKRAEASSMEQVALAALSAQIQYWPRRKGRRRASRRTTGARHRWIDRVSKYSADCKCLGARALPGGGGGVASVLLFFLLLFLCFLLLLRGFFLRFLV